LGRVWGWDPGWGAELKKGMAGKAGVQKNDPELVWGQFDVKG